MSSKIEWCDESRSFWRGCFERSEGCVYCYVKRMMEQEGVDFRTLQFAADEYCEQPLHWKKSRVIFCNAMSDFFDERAEERRYYVWDIIRRAHWHVWLILTKRIKSAATMLPHDWGRGYEHVWLGVSVENQRRALERVPFLINQIPAAHKWLSCEPLLEQVDLRGWLGKGKVEWVSTGGESGLQARFFNPAWAKKIVYQCERAGVPVWHKQNGGNTRINGTWGGDELDGQVYHEAPGWFGEQYKQEGLF